MRWSLFHCCCLVAVMSDSLRPRGQSLSGSSVHGIFQTRILEWVAISFSRRSSQPRKWILVYYVSCIAGKFFNCWAIREAHYLPISWHLFKFISIESVMVFNHLILSHPLLLLPSIFPSIRVFSNELALCIRWPKYWRFSFSISPSNEYSGLISLRIDWFDLLAVQGTLKSLLQHQFESIN